MDSRFAAWALVLATPLAAQAPVVVVDAAGGAGSHYTKLPDALSAAPDGAVVLVRSGTYQLTAGFFPYVTVSGKGLHVIGDANAFVRIQGTCIIGGLSGTQSYSWVGIDDVDALGTGVAVSVGGSTGWGWFESFATAPSTNCSSVASSGGIGVIANRSVFRGYNALAPLSGSAGFGVSGGGAHLYDSQVVGGSTFTAPHGPNIVHADLALNAAYAFVSGGQVDGTVSVSSIGASSMDVIGANVTGATAPPATLHPGPARSYATNTPIREGQAVQLEFSAPAGELAMLKLSLQPFGAFLPFYTSSTVIDTSYLLVQVMGFVPASGKLVKSIPTQPGLATGGAALFYTQASFADLSTLTLRFGGGSLIVVLDGAY
jgi:hypothetical protein